MPSRQEIMSETSATSSRRSAMAVNLKVRNATRLRRCLIKCEQKRLSFKDCFLGWQARVDGTDDSSDVIAARLLRVVFVIYVSAKRNP